MLRAAPFRLKQIVTVVGESAFAGFEVTERVKMAASPPLSTWITRLA